MVDELYTPVETIRGGEFILCTAKHHDNIVAITDRDEDAQQYYGGLGYTLPYEGIKECKSAGVDHVVIVEQPSERELKFDIDDYIVGDRIAPHPTRQRVDLFVPRENALQTSVV